MSARLTVIHAREHVVPVWAWGQGMSTVCGVDLAGSSGQTVLPACPTRPLRRDRLSSASRSVQLTDLDAGRARGGGLWALIPRRRPAPPRLVGASRTEADSLLAPIIQSAKRTSVADLWRSPCRLLSASISRKRVPRQGQPFLWWAVSLDLSLLSSGIRQRRRRERCDASGDR